MVSYTAMIQSKHRPQQVFDYLARFSSAQEWDPGIVDAEMLTPAPVGKGSRFRLVSKLLGKTIELDYELSAFERPSRFVVIANGAGFTSEDTIEVAPSGNGAMVRYHATLRFSNAGRLLTPLWWLVFRRIGSKAAKGLKETLNRDSLVEIERTERKAT